MAAVEYEYRELDNIIYRTVLSKLGRKGAFFERIVNGEWQGSPGREAMDARTQGAPMTEQEAREFQGEGWPAETAKTGDPHMPPAGSVLKPVP